MSAHLYKLLGLILGASIALSPDSEALPQSLLWTLHLGTPARNSGLLSHQASSDGFTHSSFSVALFRKPYLT